MFKHPLKFASDQLPTYNNPLNGAYKETSGSSATGLMKGCAIPNVSRILVLLV